VTLWKRQFAADHDVWGHRLQRTTMMMMKTFEKVAGKDVLPGQQI
jgi:hypothetical protein